MATKNDTPLESVEQKQVVRFLENNGLLFSAPAQSTWTKSYKQKRENYEMGTRPGLPDLFIYIPPDKSIDGEPYLIPIEMKRAEKALSRVSPAQQQWHEAINSVPSNNIAAYICYGADEAIKIVTHYLKTVDNSIF